MNGLEPGGHSKTATPVKNILNWEMNAELWNVSPILSWVVISQFHKPTQTQVFWIHFKPSCEFWLQLRNLSRNFIWRHSQESALVKVNVRWSLQLKSAIPLISPFNGFPQFKSAFFSSPKTSSNFYNIRLFVLNLHLNTSHHTSRP